MIPDNVKEAVKQQILKDLRNYFEQAEEAEDDAVQESGDVGNRVEDFYLAIEHGMRAGKPQHGKDAI